MRSVWFFIMVEGAFEQINLQQAALLELPEAEYLALIGGFGQPTFEVGQQHRQRLQVLSIPILHG